MGQNEGARSNQPQHLVYLDAYFIQKTELTRGAFHLFVLESGNVVEGWLESYQQSESSYPVVGVVWKDARAYCEWAGMRLPSEAQWEKAARGDDGRLYPWGNRWDAGLANTRASGHGGVLPVGSYPGNASPYGVLDMSGNALEWVADFFAPDYYERSPERNPAGPEIISDHGLRGGSFDSPPEYATTFFRDSSHSVMPNPRVGFRCAREAAP